MEGIRQWAFALCTAMVVCSAAQMILPRGNMQKIMQVTLSVFFLCCLLSPIALQNSDLRIAWRASAQEEIDQRAERLTSEVERQTGRAAQTEATEFVMQELAEAGINPREITIHMNESGQSTPVVQLRLNETDRNRDKEVRAMIEGLGLEAELLYTKEG